MPLSNAVGYEQSDRTESRRRVKDFKLLHERQKRPEPLVRPPVRRYRRAVSCEIFRSALGPSNGHTRARDVRARRGRCETPAPQRRLTCAEPEAPPRPLPLPVAPPVVPPAALRASCAAGSAMDRRPASPRSDTRKRGGGAGALLQPARRPGTGKSASSAQRAMETGSRNMVAARRITSSRRRA